MHLVVNFSGGRDSCAMLAWICEQYPHATKHVVFADTGWEHRDAEVWSRMIVSRFGLDLVVVRSSTKDFFSMVRHRRMFPGMHQRQCTSDLKRAPIQKWIRGNLKGVVVSCMGLRAQESKSRAAKPCLQKNATLSKAGRDVWDWNPILGWSHSQVGAYLAARGIPEHPVYQYLRRFSCRVCIYMSPADVRQVRMYDPEAFDLVAMLEREISFTMFSHGTIEEYATCAA